MTLSYALLILTAFGLGVRHGFDLDHLATIDSITRSVNSQQYLAKVVGFLFSVGHGLIVVLLSSMIGLGLFKSTFPHWLDGLGNWISVFFLFIFGVNNVYSVFKTRDALLINYKGGLIKILLRKKNQPLFIMLIGALFALSFDTFTQVSLFSLEAATVSSWFFSSLLGLIFMIGMIVADGVNGYLVGVLLANIDKKSRIISNVFGIMISFFSLMICTINLTKLLV